MVFRNPWTHHSFALLILVGLVFSLLLPYRNIPLAIDSSIFAAVGLHLNHGKVLYRDAWDHKPPVVFFLNALALRFGGEDHRSIRDLQLLFGCLNVLAFYWLSRIVFDSKLTPFFCSILFVFSFYHPMIYGGGNFTEEYGVFFVLLGVLGIAHWSITYHRKKILPLFFAGIGFGTAALTKEPFVFSFIPWFFYTLLFSKGGWLARINNTPTLLAGCLFVAMLPVFYFLKHQAFGSWVEVIQYGFHYTDRFSDETFLEKQSEGLFRVSELIFSNSTLLILLFVLGVASLARSYHLKRTRYIPLFTLYWLIFDFFATSLSGMFFLHYYLQMIPSVLLMSASGFFLLLKWTRDQALHLKWVMVSVLFFFAVIDFTLPGMLANSPPLPSEKTADSVTEYLNENIRVGDTLWVSNGYMARYYLQTGMLSPTRYLAVFPHHLQLGASTKIDPAKMDEIHKDLTESPPTFIVGSDLFRYPYFRKEYFDWFQTRYSITPLGGEIDLILVFHRTNDPSESLAEHIKNWASKEAQSGEELSYYQRRFLRLQQGSVPQLF